MDYSWIDAYCLAKKGAVRDYKAEWDATRYMLRSKMFAMMGGDKMGQPIFTVKLEPLYGQLLRAQFQEIIPGYYMNKEHWNSLYLSGNVPNEVVKSMIDQAYTLIFKGLPQKTQNEILEA